MYEKSTEKNSVKWLFSGASHLWSSVNWAARRISPLLKRKVRLRARSVVSVGNLQAGGSGKTPVVGLLAKQAVSKGKSVAVLLRGYGAERENQGGVIAPFQEKVDPFEYGDEAALIHQWVPEAWIGVGKDRVASFHGVWKAAKSAVFQNQPIANFAATLEEKQDPRDKFLPVFDFVFLDDGFQQFRIHKDYELVLLTGHSRNTAFFRSYFSELKLAHGILLTKGDQVPSELMPDRKEIPCFNLKFQTSVPPYLEGFGPPSSDLNPALEGKTAKKREGGLLVTGIADTRPLLKELKEQSVSIERHIRFGDHHAYTHQQLEKIVQLAHQQIWEVFTTEKDYIKWKALGWDIGYFKKQGVLLTVLKQEVSPNSKNDLQALFSLLGI